MLTPIQPDALVVLEECDALLHQAIHTLMVFRGNTTITPLSLESIAACRVTLSRVLDTANEFMANRSRLLSILGARERALKGGE